MEGGSGLRAKAEKTMSTQGEWVLVVGPWECPEEWPTNCGSKALWEELGRTVGTFSTLEDMVARALYAITGHKSLKRAWEEPDSVLKTEYAELVEEIKELRAERNRLCHGAWTDFETPDTATVRYFANGKVLDKKHREARSLDDLRSSKERAIAVIAELKAVVEERPIQPASEALWEEVGRAVATFGTLEDVLARTLYVITGHQKVKEDDAPDEQVEEWCEKLISHMSDTLGGLAHVLGAAWNERDGVLHRGNKEIVDEITAVAKERNRLCHKAWGKFLAPTSARTGDVRNEIEFDSADHEARTREKLRSTRDRVVAVISALRTEVRVTYKTGFPGANDL